MAIAEAGKDKKIQMLKNLERKLLPNGSTGQDETLAQKKKREKRFNDYLKIEAELDYVSDNEDWETNWRPNPRK
jgi:hypothetical protein